MSDADSCDDAEEGYDDSGGAAEAAPEAAVKDQPWTAEAVPAVVRAQGGGAAKAEAAVAGTAQPCAAEAVAASSSGRFWRHRQWALLEQLMRQPAAPCEGAAEAEAVATAEKGTMAQVRVESEAHHEGQRSPA